MPPILNKEQYEKEQQVVTIVNEGDKEVIETYGGIMHRIKPKSYMMVPIAKAWLWFGRPDARESPSDWNNELKRVQNRQGFVYDDPATHVKWNYITSGKLYVKEFGKGSQFYSKLNDKPVVTLESTPLDDADLGELAAEGSLADVLLEESTKKKK